MVDEYIPIVLFLVIGAIVAVVQYFQFRGRREIQMTVRSAIESGHPMDPETIGKLVQPVDPQTRDRRRAVISLALGAAVLVLALLLGEGAMMPLLGISAFPFLIGLAYLVLSMWPKTVAGHAQ